MAVFKLMNLISNALICFGGRGPLPKKKRSLHMPSPEGQPAIDANFPLLKQVKKFKNLLFLVYPAGLPFPQRRQAAVDWGD